MQEDRRTPIVWVPNKGMHDYSDAERFGILRFLTDGHIQRFATGALFTEIQEALKEAQAQDFLMISSLPIVASIATAVLTERFGRINYLLWSNGAYVERNISFS